MKGTFSRVSPAMFAEKTGIPLGWMVISHRWMVDKSERRRAHGRWYLIKSAYGEAFRVLRFSANLPGGPSVAGELVVDWPAWLELNGYADDVSKPLDLEFQRARWWQLPQLAFAHPDPAFRLASVLSLVSVGLGTLSIALAVLLT